MSYGVTTVSEVAVGVDPAVGKVAVGGVMFDPGAVGDPFV
jgi:hypothetical protein